MNLSITQEQSSVPVTVILISGDIDASNYLLLVEKARDAFRAGTVNLLLDLSQTPFLSSSGLVALHSIALLARGKEPLDPQLGWGAFREMGEGLPGGLQEHFKLLNPQPRVLRTLERSGMTESFAIFTDRAEALASF